MVRMVGQLVLAASLVMVAACEDSKDSSGSANPLASAGGFTGVPTGGSKQAAPDTAKPKTDPAKPGEAAKGGGLATLGATPARPAGTPAAGTADPAAAAAAELAKQAADLANQAGAQLGTTPGTLPGLSNVPGMTGPKKAPTVSSALARLSALERQACACSGRPCAANALTTFGILFKDIQYLQTGKATYAKVKATSARITTCLIKNGITGPEVMALFTGGKKTPSVKATPSRPTGPSGSASALATRLEGMATQACMCKDKSCATRALGSLAAYYAMNKDVQANEAQLTRIKNASAKMARCLVENGIDPKTLQAIFQ